MNDRVIVSADCGCDLPESLIEKYNIPIMYSYVQTENARFQDINEINSDSIIEYIEHDNIKITSTCAAVEEYRTFFTEQTDSGKQPLIHITLSKKMSHSYNHAVEAAKYVKNVYVVDSGSISSGTGMFVLIAADLARRHAPLKLILNELEKVREHINFGLVLRTTQYITYNSRMSEKTNNLVSFLECKPMAKMKKGAMKISGICYGNEYSYSRKFIHHMLRNRKKIDDYIVIISTSGCSYGLQQFILKEINKKIKWKHVIISNSSATNSCNTGSGSFGIMFMDKK